MKKFFAFVKRAFTGKINSMEDVKQRRKDLRKLLIPSVIAAGVCVVLGIIPPLNFMSFLTPFPGLFALVVLFFLYIVKRIESRFKFLHCDNCGHDTNMQSREEFDAFVYYESLGISTSISKPLLVDGQAPGVYKKVELNGSISVKIRLTLTCAECGTPKVKEFTLTPFKCSVTHTNVKTNGAGDLNILLDQMRANIEEAIADCLNEDLDCVPVTVQSIHHWNYENKAKPGCEGANEPYKGVTVKYFRYVDELIDGYFLRNELNF